MKKFMVLSLSSLLILSSCGSYEAAGAYTSAQFGSIIGSAIGGITGGWRGHDIGTIVGMAGGAAVGAAIGKAAEDQADKRALKRYFDDQTLVPTEPVVPLEIREAHVVDLSHDGVLSRGESARVVFEIHNPTEEPAFGVQPSVIEITGNRHIRISENILVECIRPKQTIRYTAQLKADNGLRRGEAVIRVSVLQGGREISSQSREFRIVTTK